jgi:hypothetical protein
MENIEPQKVDSMGRKTYSAEDRERLMAECAASGLSRKEFALQRGIKYATLIEWHTRSGKRWNRPSDTMASGIKLKKLNTVALFSNRRSTGQEVAEITFGNVSIKLYREVSGPFLKELLGAVGLI